MKKINIFNGLLGVAAVLALSACSSDYLDLSPESDPNTEQIGQSLSAAKLAVRGIASQMNTQYDGFSVNQYSGEAWLNSSINEACGSDCFVGLATSFGDVNLNWDYFGNENGWFSSLGWQYAYGLIHLANAVIQRVDEIPLQSGESEDERQLLKGQALTFRAHAYIKLVQWFAPRYEDDPEGNKYCMVKRVTDELGNSPLVQLKEIKELIYSDLDLAIKSFDNAGNLDREYKWETNRNVACGLYARAAMIFHDWKIAKQMAHDAQNGYEVMDNKTMFAGFFSDNNDIMWTQSDYDGDIYYWSWGSHYACNGHYVKAWNIGGNSINLDLYNQMDPNDARREMFLTPDKVTTHKKLLVNKDLKVADFWSPELVNAPDMSMASGAAAPVVNPDGSYDMTKKWGLVNFIGKLAYNYYANVFTGDRSKVLDSKDPFIAYMGISSTAQGSAVLVDNTNGKKTYGTLYATPIGASLKFWSIAPYGTGCVPFMRCSEMVLTEAEAAYMDNDFTTARKCLDKIQSKRISGYVGDKTGDALLEEIRLSRRVELFGEGFGWNDLKRWNVPMIRRPWKANDPTSGNVPSEYGCVRQPNEQAGWRLMVPASESNYNGLIDRNLLPQPQDYTDAKK